DGVRVRAVARRAAGDRQLQLRPSNRSRRVARRIGPDGVARGEHADRDRPAPRPARDAQQPTDPGCGVSDTAIAGRCRESLARFRRAGSRSIVRLAVTNSPLGPDSERVAEARARAQERLHRQREALRPVGLVVLLVVVVASANSDPALSLNGKGLAVTVSL